MNRPGSLADREGKALELWRVHPLHRLCYVMVGAIITACCDMVRNEGRRRWSAAAGRVISTDSKTLEKSWNSKAVVLEMNGIHPESP